MEITQKAGLFGGKFTIGVTNHDELVFTHEKLLNKNESKYLLDNIDPLYQSYKQFSTAAAITSTLFLIVAIFLFWYGKANYEPPNDVGYLFMGTILIIASLIAGIKAFKSKLNIVSFYSLDGRRLFSLYGNKPSITEVENFCSALKKRIERIKYHGEISNERMSDILAKHVEFLVEHEVLSPSEKESALKRISNKTKLNIVKLTTHDGNLV